MSETTNYIHPSVCPKCGSNQKAKYTARIESNGDRTLATAWTCNSRLLVEEKNGAEVFKQSTHCELNEQLTALRTEKAELAAKLAEREKFKAYTHQRMDEAGVPEVVPESPHTAAGCRIGGRFDWLESKVRDLIKSRDTYCAAAEIATRCNGEHRRTIEGMQACLDENAVDMDRLAAAESREAALREACRLARIELAYIVDQTDAFQGGSTLRALAAVREALLSRPSAEPTKDDGDGGQELFDKYVHR